MTRKKFNGTIELDIRNSTPDWTPYAEPRAKEGAKNILYLVIDDTGFGAWEMYGGKIKMPNLQKLAERGLVYTNFHTTALCSPTRSSLLNGRNATSNGMSCIEEATSGFPGSNGRIPFENALIPAVLTQEGYSTFALGKWHLLPEEEATLAASKRNWPLGRGFERYYGFLGGETDQWYPDIVYDNHLSEQPYEPDIDDPVNGYHLSKDLVDRAISFVQDHRAIADKKPWMMYFSPGANHAPHQIWPQKVLDYGYNTTLHFSRDDKKASFESSSVFSEGYEKYREDTLANMKELGIFGAEIERPTKINPHNEGLLDEQAAASYDDGTEIIGVPEGAAWPPTDYVRPWETLSREERALFIRMAEIYAAFSTYTDEQIGRLIDFLDKIGELENTIIVAVADNGASAEGGPNGSVNENLFFNDVPDSLEQNLAMLDHIGTDKTYNHYPTGWAWGFDAPFKYWKRWSGYEGGAATPFIIAGPGVREPSDCGEVKYRKQYIHAVDLVPTLYEMAEIDPPDTVMGYPQNPIEGISFAYTFDDEYAKAENACPYKEGALKPTDADGNVKKVRESQFYSMLGTRGIWHKGWHACTVHAPTPSDWGHFEDDIWELYCMDGDTVDDVTVDADPIQEKDLAKDYPSKLEALKNMWFVQAGIYNGLPLDDRSTSAVLGTPRPQLSDPPFGDNRLDRAKHTYTYYPGGSEIPEAVAPNVRTRSYSIAAHITLSSTDPAEGVLWAHGGRFGGHSFYLHEGRLCYVYNWLGQRAQKISCPLPANETELVVKISFDKAGGMPTSGPAGYDAANYGASVIGDVELSIKTSKDKRPQPVANPDYGVLELDVVAQRMTPTTEWYAWKQPWASDDADKRFMTQPAKFALSGEGMNVGRDGGQSVSPLDYGSPGTLVNAQIEKVDVTIKNDAAEMDTEKEFLGMLWRD